MITKMTLPKSSHYSIRANPDTVVGALAIFKEKLSPSSQQAYEKRFKGMDFKSLDEICQYPDVLLARFNSHQISFSTYKQYRASFMYCLALIYENELSLPFAVDNQVIADTYRHTFLISNSIDSNTIKQSRRETKLNGHTSTHKAKFFSPDVYNVLMGLNGKKFNDLKRFVYFNVRLGLRPKEYATAKVMRYQDYKADNAPKANHNLDVNFLQDIKDNSNSEYVIVVQNAKNSHGRTFGKERVLCLHGFNDKQINQLKVLIEQSKMPNFHQRLRYQLNQLVKTPEIMNDIKENFDKRFNVWQEDPKGLPPVMNMPTLYSTRHQAVANAKKQGLNPVVIACLFGHGSIKTAQEHYGKRKQGSSGGNVKISPAIETVLMACEKIPKQQLHLAGVLNDNDNLPALEM